MGFDAILGVGRTPQITNDLYFNPYAIDIDKIQNYSPLVRKITITDDAGTTDGAFPDRLNNLISQTSLETDYSIYRSVATAGNTFDIDFDTGRNLYFDKIGISYSTTGDGDTMSITIMASDDGANFTTISSETVTVATADTEIKYSYGFNAKGRVIRVRFRIETYTAPAFVLQLFKFKFFYANLQY